MNLATVGMPRLGTTIPAAGKRLRSHAPPVTDELITALRNPPGSNPGTPRDAARPLTESRPIARA
jgi:hypothetical protein